MKGTGNFVGGRERERERFTLKYKASCNSEILLIHFTVVIRMSNMQLIHDFENENPSSQPDPPGGKMGRRILKKKN